MPYFARLNSDNVVIFNERVNNVADGDAAGEAFLRALYGTTDRFRFNKYDGSIRKKFAGIGDTFDEGADVFIAPRPFASWMLDDNHDWQPPTPRPEGDRWYWDEGSLSWKQP